LEETEFEIESIKRAFELNIDDPNSIYLIAEINNKSVGYLSCHSQFLLHHGGQKIAEIQEMYVNPENRKMGIGKKMINELKRIAYQKGIEQLEVTSNNKRNKTHRFYEREKFVQSHKKFTWKVS
ncbi:MAG: GNAT family N-acetyltransferase, partial [Bacteroidota bacterium]